MIALIAQAGKESYLPTPKKKKTLVRLCRPWLVEVRSMLQKHLMLIQFNLLQLTASICKDNFTQHVDGVLIARKQKFDDKRKLVLNMRPELVSKQSSSHFSPVNYSTFQNTQDDRVLSFALKADANC
jgi:hypothetical protein